jgi:hypothetical protein
VSVITDALTSNQQDPILHPSPVFADYQEPVYLAGPTRNMPF